MTAKHAEDNPEVGWLWRIVGDRAELESPMTIEWRGETWTVATDGRRFAMRRGDYGFPPPSSNLTVPKMLDRAMDQGQPFSIDLAALRAVAVPHAPLDLPSCDVCENTGREECDECDGRGAVDCTCHCGDEHENECEACNGDGWNVCACNRIPPKESDLKKLYIGVGMFNVALFSTVLPHVPGDTGEWRQVAHDRAATLVIGEWTLLFMPLRQIGERNQHLDIPRIALLQESAA